MFAKIVDEKTKLVSAGLGTATDFYRSIGMKEMDVEKGYDGQYYVSGFAPEKPQKIIDEERIEELKNFLSGSDWYVARFSETGVAVPVEISAARAAARVEISELRSKYEVANDNLSMVGVDNV